MDYRTNRKSEGKEVSSQYDKDLGGTSDEGAKGIGRATLDGNGAIVSRTAGGVDGQFSDFSVWRRGFYLPNGTCPDEGGISLDALGLSLDALERLFDDFDKVEEIVPLFEKVIALAKNAGTIKTYFKTQIITGVAGEADFPHSWLRTGNLEVVYAERNDTFPVRTQNEDGKRRTCILIVSSMSLTDLWKRLAPKKSTRRKSMRSTAGNRGSLSRLPK